MITKKPWVAGLLSLALPGLGHFYNGQIKKALLIYFGIWVYLILAWILPLGYSFNGLLCIVCFAVVSNLLILFNAILTTRRKRIIENKKYDKWYIYVIILIVAMLLFEFCYPLIKLRLAKFQFSKASTIAMAPSLTEGDQFAWKATQTLERNDIAVFKFPLDTNGLFVFRCVAEPSDELQVKQGKVYINKKSVDDLNNLMFRFMITTNGTCINPSNYKKFGMEEVRIIKQTYDCIMTNENAESLRLMPFIKHVTLTLMPENIKDHNIFPFDSTLNWNPDFYGPILLPKKGMKIQIDTNNVVFYGVVIKLCENETSVELTYDRSLRINGHIVNSYTFKHNYYFMMGDNRPYSSDSRYMGIVPDYLIKGKGLYIWWSNQMKKIGSSL